MTTGYDAAERAFLDRVRQGQGRPDLAAAARDVHAAAVAWESEAYAAFFARRDQEDADSGEIFELEIDAERAELLAGLWSDLADAYGDA